MKSFKNLALLFSSMFLLMVIVSSFTKTSKAADSNFEIASEKHVKTTDKALRHLEKLEFDKWSQHLSDDIEYYFPDGDAGTRTKLIGKTEVMNWWKNWSVTSGIEQMSITNSVHVPVLSKKSLAYTGLSGVMVLSYFSNKMVYNGKPVNIRMHWAAHFNEDNLIDKYYTYYDRSPIIDVVKENILEAEKRKK